MPVDQICRRLGEAKVKEMFHSLNAGSMKKVLAGSGIPAVRLPGHSSTRKRNEDWANRLWGAMNKGPAASTVLLFEWLASTRNQMLATFLDAIGVSHQRGMTESDFLKDTSDDKLLAAAQALLQDERFDRQEVAIYLLFLDLSNGTHKFDALALEQYLPPAPTPAAS